MISKGFRLFRIQGVHEWELKCQAFWLLIIKGSVTEETRVLWLVVSLMTVNFYLLFMAPSNE
jgi:hypothetical protein